MRDNRLDILRGFAMVTIVINHLSAGLVKMGLDGWEVPTPTLYGWSSAAELFVLMSGYMAGMVYLNRPNARARLSGRAVHLFKVNILMFTLVLPLVFIAPEILLTTFRIDPLLVNPVRSITLFSVFLYSPRLLDVLQLYIILMLAMAAVLPFLIKRPWLTLALSFIVYAIVQRAHFINLPTSPIDNRKPTFNPFAWQLLFFAAVIAGKHQLHHKVFAAARRLPVLLPALALLILIAVFRYAENQDLVPSMIGIRKPSLGPVRIIHAGLLVIAYAGLIDLLGSFRSHWLVDSVASIGRNSLNCFALSVVGTYYYSLFWWHLGGSWSLYVCTLCLLLVTVRTGAWYWDWKKASAAGLAKPPSLTEPSRLN